MPLILKLGQSVITRMIADEINQIDPFKSLLEKLFGSFFGLLEVQLFLPLKLHFFMAFAAYWMNELYLPTDQIVAVIASMVKLGCMRSDCSDSLLGGAFE